MGHIEKNCNSCHMEIDLGTRKESQYGPWMGTEVRKSMLSSPEGSRRELRNRVIMGDSNGCGTNLENVLTERMEVFSNQGHNLGLLTTTHGDKGGSVGAEEKT
ncbi:unnamed protein product [Ilex paraguariensis]|uniref:Uncharacterized protein n=1 Tax=Ilex paraguariensis TaxID=185542 RepID=A0ABC8RED1_9AQUA